MQLIESVGYVSSFMLRNLPLPNVSPLYLYWTSLPIDYHAAETGGGGTGGAGRPHPSTVAVRRVPAALQSGSSQDGHSG